MQEDITTHPVWQTKNLKISFNGFIFCDEHNDMLVILTPDWGIA